MKTCTIFPFICVTMSLIGCATLQNASDLTPFPDEKDEVGERVVTRLSNIRPNIIVGYLALRQADNVVTDGDIVSAIISSVSDAPDITLSYRGHPKSWLTRHAMPDDHFVDFVNKKEPSLYACLMYFASDIYTYYLEREGRIEIFLLDRLTYEKKDELLPSGAKILPTDVTTK